MSSIDYVQEAIKVFEDRLAKDGKKLPPCALTPIKTNFQPELDQSDELDAGDTEYFQEVIGML